MQEFAKKIVFYDLEMYCNRQGLPEKLQETIRIGAVCVEEDGRIRLFDEFVKPLFHKRISSFCQRLTGIKQKDIQYADTFEIVFEKFLKWTGDYQNTTFISWGSNDLRRIGHDFDIHKMKKNKFRIFENNHINLQHKFSTITAMERSVAYMLEVYGDAFIGKKHNPKYDAYNTYKIFRHYSTRKNYTDLLRINERIFFDSPERFSSYEKTIMKLDRDEPIKEKTLRSLQNKISKDVKNAFYKDMERFNEEFKGNSTSKSLKRMKKRLLQIKEKYFILSKKNDLYKKIDFSYEKTRIDSFYKKVSRAKEKYTSKAEQPLPENFFEPTEKLIKHYKNLEKAA
jgi:inhibitor of KinA sporulation pathway (predicted exonuclease)